MLRLSTVTVDLDAGVVRSGDRSTTTLTPRERAVLRHLATRAGEVVSRDELLRVLGQPEDSLSRIVDTLVCRLRTKLEADPSQPVHLLTEYGVGYRLRSRVAATSAPAASGPRRTLALDSGTVCLETGRLDRRDGTVHTLLGVELGLLRELATASGRVVDGRVLERRVWGNVLARSNRLRNLVYRLRSRIENDPGAPRHLLAVRGQGYRFLLADRAPESGTVTVLSARVEGSDSQVLWDAAVNIADRTDGYVATLAAGQAMIVWSSPAAASRALAALDQALPGLRIGVVTGQATRVVHPLTGRHAWVGPAVTLADRRSELDAVLADQPSQRVSAA